MICALSCSCAIVLPLAEAVGLSASTVAWLSLLRMVRLLKIPTYYRTAGVSKQGQGTVVGKFEEGVIEGAINLYSRCLWYLVSFGVLY